MVPYVGLRCVIVAFPGHTHILFYTSCYDKRGNQYVMPICQQSEKPFVMAIIEPRHVISNNVVF